MSESAAAADAARDAMPASGRMSAQTRWRIFAYASSLLFTVVWTVAQGKDVHWDAINYHLYLGFSALNDRFTTDFFAAGTPSYINPYAYVPLYLMNSAGLPAIAMAVVFASFHALILWFTYELALVSGTGNDRERVGFALLAMLLAFLSPVLLQVVGSTMVDISTGLMVVGGWFVIARSFHEQRLAPMAWAGLICGAAAALKLSNAVYAAAAIVMIPFIAAPWIHRARAMALYGAGCAAAFVAVSAPWSWRLWQEFGNPMFPFMNTWFASPDFTSAPLRYERFLPTSGLDFLSRPFDMLSSRSMVHTEPRAADMRFAALLVALVAWIALQGRAAFRAPAYVGRRSNEHPAATRLLVALTVALIVAWCLWLVLSGNSRYFLPMGCIASVVLAMLLQRLYQRWRDATVVIAGVMVMVQVVLIAIGSDWKRDGLSWGGPWLRVESPARFHHEPHLFLSTGFLSGSALLPYWHPDSGMINIRGFYAIGPGRPGGERAQALIDRNLGRLRVLTPLPKDVVDRATLPGPPNNLDVFVRRFGLRVDANDCEFIRIEGNLRGSARPDEDRNRWTSYMTCRLEPSPGAAAAYAQDVKPIDEVFDRVEAVCPNLFHPPHPLTEEYRAWGRVYNMGSELQLWIERGRVLYFSPVKGGNPIDIGSVEAWSRGPQPIDCSRKWDPISFEFKK